MCGICGLASTVGVEQDLTTLKKMCRVLKHRGPDDEGYYIDDYAGLGMRRLSIIDLATGHQPIANENGSIWVVFNGEIYNFQELRDQLISRGHVFSTKTDTEVIIHAYEEYGDDCLNYFNGMFGIAIWDQSKRRLLLARDRVGIKPLYYWENGQKLIFGSELKSVIQHPDVPLEVNPVALNHFLTLEYIPAPWTIFKDIKKLPAGHFLTFENGKCSVKQYWNIQIQNVPTNEAECVEVLTDLIRDAVRLRLISDVPLGAFLSGGIDSSSIVSFMAETSTQPVQTFSIGFDDKTYNELDYARLVAQKFSTNHYEEILQPDINEMVGRLAPLLDEPFGDFSIFPTYLVSEVARQQVTVVLSGDGGDELFGGYETYVAQNLDRYYGLLPSQLRQSLFPALLNKIPPSPAKKGFINKAKRFVEGSSLPTTLQHTRWMTFMSDADKSALYQPDLLASINGNNTQFLIEDFFNQATHFDSLAQQQYVDIKTYLVDNILVKVDRMSMAASLEARVPLLDHRIVEFALSLPPQMKLQRGQTKRILRQAVANRIPSEILDKPKQGFSIPLKHWLRGPLRPLMTDLLSNDTINRRGYFSADQVSTWMTQHLEQRANHSHRLWALMVFEMWHQNIYDAKRTT